MKNLSQCCLLVMAMVLTATQAQAQLNLANLPKACLPEAGRMERDQSAACHCPPPELCPTNLEEWETHPRMPSGQALICCDRPCDPKDRNGECYVCDPANDLDRNDPNSACYVPCDPKDPNGKCYKCDPTDRNGDCYQCDPNNPLDRDDPNSACYVPCDPWAANSPCAPIDQGGGGNDNGGPGDDCFSAQTPVLMADGSTKPIESIVPGDRVSGKLSINTVKRVITKKWDSLVMYDINDGALEFTADHPIMTKEGWKAVDYDLNDPKLKASYDLKMVGALKVGDVIRLKDGELEIKSLKPTQTLTNHTTFNLELDGDKTFFANQIHVRSF